MDLGDVFYGHETTVMAYVNIHSFANFPMSSFQL